MARFISFKKKYAEKILAGEKTATIRLSDFFRENEIYDVRVGWFKPSLCRVKIIRKKRKRLKDIGREEILKDGFSNLEEFQRAWTSIYGRWDPEQQVWVYEFRLLNPENSARKFKNGAF